MFVPVTPMLVIFNTALPVFVSVTVWAGLVVPTCWPTNVRLGVDRLTTGAGGGVPVPVRETACGLPAALSVTVTEAAREPVAVGVKVTLIVQVPLLAATELPQVLVCA